MRYLLKILAIIVLLTSSYSLLTAQENPFFNGADQFLRTYVDKSGNVDYKAIVKNPTLLNKTITQIEEYDSKGNSSDELKAFYTNAYNILVIKQIVERYPIVGPLAVDGFFDKIKNKIAGEELTLNQIEKDKNLYVNRDERLHFALVCGAKGCPPLANFAFTPKNIESQLEDRTRLALNNDVFIQVKQDKTEVSQIFSWYKDDFEKKDVKGIVGYLNKYRKNQIPFDTRIVYYEYDWNLNIQ
ncbi:DUF547 domain-containing protein [Reichenbachiella sp. MALMAid0571]|uniref:DUF547 domain-containing protein n=1 Tax=Reichenbachiella sp. MALMAid0571 TaxID=3143939 RepID=UPI0032E01849